MIEYCDVYKGFDEPVLNGVSLRVKSGERMAIVGPSGTGKSVLLKTTIGLIRPDRGDVLVDGESVVNAPRQALDRIRRRVGYVFQSSALFDSLNIYQNMVQGLPEDAEKTLGQREVMRRVVESLHNVNLDPGPILAKLPAELSGGMRKRVGLARVLVGAPEVLLYDEPVTGLDPVNAAIVSRLITSIGERLHATSILVTHDIERALPICDRIALLDHGRMRFVGTPAEFVRSGDLLVRAYAHRDVADAFAVEERP
jgi:phospholipid/cholesterol/gamma-HCH transport system ATP-binding protein